MARRKETNSVAHRLRRVFIISAIVMAAATIVGVGFIAFGAAPSLLIANATFLGFALATTIGAGVGINVIASKSEEKTVSNKNRKYLEKISKLDKDKTAASVKEKQRIAQKYAKTNLKLCKITGTPLTGTFHSISYMDSEKATRRFNEIDAYQVLIDSEVKKTRRNKFSKKIAKKKALIQDGALKSPACKWTLSYDNFLPGKSIMDRRTEIACMNDATIEEFKSMAKTLAPTQEIGANIIVRFNDEGKYVPTYARIADKSKIDEVKNLLMKDIERTCAGKSKTELSEIFPIVIETRKLNKKTSEYKRIPPEEINSLEELKNNLSKGTEKE